MDCHTSRPHCRWSIRRISGNWWRMIYTQGMTCSVGHYAIKGKGLWPCRPFAIIQFYLLDSVGIFRLTRLQSEAVWLGMPQSTKYVSDNIRCVSLAFLKCMSSNQYANTDTHTHIYIHTLAQNCRCEFCCGMHQTCKKHQHNNITRWDEPKCIEMHICNHSRRWRYKTTATDYTSPQLRLKCAQGRDYDYILYNIIYIYIYIIILYI